MRSKLSVVLLCALLISAFLASNLLGAASNPEWRSYFKLNRAPKFMIPNEKLDGQNPMLNKGEDFTASLGMIPTTSPGHQAGLTTYDYQHNGTMGRQIAFDPSNNMVHFVWMAQTNYIIPGDRSIKYQAYDAPANNYTQASGGKVVTQDYSGYVSCAALADGRGYFACHTDPGSGYKSTAYFDFLPGFGIYSSEVCTPDIGAPWYLANMETIWPITDVQYGTDTVYLVLSHVFEGSEDMILYRKVNSGAFDNGQYIETVTDLAYTVVADPNSDNVAIVYTDDRGGLAEAGGGQDDLDVYYKLSTDQGATWGPAINVTNYTGDSLSRAYDDLSALYTTDGNLHIMWCARELRDSTTYENYKSRLMHWSTDVPQARIVAEARYDMGPLCDPDAWNLYIAKNSVSECDSKLYALWTQFGHAREPGALVDCSQLGFANGELFMAVSDDNGLTWDLPQNLTNSRTPDCDSSLCDSDHWSSMTKYGMVYAGTDTLDILYINDKDAGGIPQGSGTWCVDPVMHLRVPCRDVIPTPQISLSPNNFLDPLQTPGGVQLDSTLTIINTGNASLSWSAAITYDNGSGWMSIVPDNGTVPSGASNTEVTAVHFNVGGAIAAEPTGWDGYIIFASDAPTSPDTIPVHLTVGSINLPENALLSTTCKDLMVYNTGRVGGNNQNASLDIPGDCDTVDQYPNSSMYLYDGSPILTYLDGANKLEYSAIWTQLFTEGSTWRPQTGLTFASEADYDQYSYTVSTSDSLFGIDVTMVAPTDGSNCYVIGLLDFYLWGSTPAKSAVRVGYIMDWDVPSDSTVDNGSGFDSPLNTIWQRGIEFNSDNLGACTTPINENDRYGGLAYFSGDILSGWTDQNSANQQGSAFKPGFIYDKMHLGAVTLYSGVGADSVNDLHEGVTFDQIDMLPGHKYSYAFALVTTNQGEADYKDQVAAAAIWYNDHFGGCCINPGDANHDGSVNIGDAVFIINYVFKHGPTPSCLQEADANHDGSINIGDAVYIINFVFKHGLAPQCGP